MQRGGRGKGIVRSEDSFALYHVLVASTFLFTEVAKRKAGKFVTYPSYAICFSTAIPTWFIWFNLPAVRPSIPLFWKAGDCTALPWSGEAVNNIVDNG